MRLLSFKKSAVSFGVELELQLIDPYSHALISRSKELIRNIKSSPFEARITPEITQSMIEINSSVHFSPDTMLTELSELQNFLLQEVDNLGVKICGGGTHPFQTWALQKIFPSMRYKNLTQRYKYLSKLATVFGQHVHVGCGSGDDAIYLVHALSRYVPQFMAMAASSPYYQRIDTGFHSSRSSVFNAFPLSGVMPYFQDWREFSDYFHKMKRLKIISSMKDFYWDIRPKPEFGTVEVRVCDTPLSILKAVSVAAYIYSLALYLLKEKPFAIHPDLYYLYSQNRFEASRYGYEGKFINPYSFDSCSIKEDILATIKTIEPYIKQAGSAAYINLLVDEIQKGTDEVGLLRKQFKLTPSLPQLVEKQCEIWSKNSNSQFISEVSDE